MLACNSDVSASTGKSPHELLYGENVPMPLDHALELPRANVAAEDAAKRATEWS